MIAIRIVPHKFFHRGVVIGKFHCSVTPSSPPHYTKYPPGVLPYTGDPYPPLVVPSLLASLLHAWLYTCVCFLAAALLLGA